MSRVANNTQSKVREIFESIKEGRFSFDDISTVVNNTENILGKSSEGALAKFFDDIKTMCAMVKSWFKKEYKGIPVKTMGMIILTLLHVFSPIDIIPDVFLGIGLMDDAMMVGLCLKAVQSDINDFRVWANNLKNLV